MFVRSSGEDIRRSIIIDVWISISIYAIGETSRWDTDSEDQGALEYTPDVSARLSLEKQ